MELNDWTSRKALVTGAAGFLGGWVCRALTGLGATVIGFDNDWSKKASTADLPDGILMVDGDVRDASALHEQISSGVDSVFHLAAQSLVEPAQADPLYTWESNVAGTWTVLEACRASKSVVSVLVASSDKAYGDIGSVAYEEEMSLGAKQPYAASKACADIIAQTYAASFGSPIIITRCGNLYGGRDVNWSRLIPGTIRSITEGQRPVIRSDGTFVRDYLYVEDAVAAVLELSIAVRDRVDLKGEAFNIAAGSRHTVLEVVAAINQVMGSELEADVRNEAVGEIPEQRLSTDKIKNMLGWQADTALLGGLERTVTWYREHPECLN